MRPNEIFLPLPRLGGKIWLLETPGCFVLERGPGLIRTDACTHGGAGATTIYDGIPDEDGRFPPRDLPPDQLAGYVADVMARLPDKTEAEAIEIVKNSAANGRRIYHAPATVMGSWMLDGGFYHGLTIIATGGHEGISPIASIVWMPRAVGRAA